MPRHKKEEPDPRFRVLGDFLHMPSTLQEFVYFEDGRHNDANVNILELRRLYKRALKKIPAHNEYFVDGKWVHESKMGRKRTGKYQVKHFEEKQIRVKPFDETDNAVVELGNRAFDLRMLQQDYSRDSKGYVSIIGTLQKEGLVTKI
ncbi:hypothetical protein HOM13_00085 [Candidatus Woesearchaeota archaeon]|jgi:hypothetical protein|nr:hypothetical protein [Candidatus Woesearchaeota archaeon]MBT5215118.1 hypothetical protein [Candidatus Woesearchaeota archaeon]